MVARQGAGLCKERVKNPRPHGSERARKRHLSIAYTGKSYHPQGKLHWKKEDQATPQEGGFVRRFSESSHEDIIWPSD
jgi:hypothetical protein